MSAAGGGRIVVRVLAVAFVLLAFVGLEILRQGMSRVREHRDGEARAEAPRRPPGARERRDRVHRSARGKDDAAKGGATKDAAEDDERARERQAVPPNAVW